LRKTGETTSIRLHKSQEERIAALLKKFAFLSPREPDITRLALDWGLKYLEETPVSKLRDAKEAEGTAK